MNLPEKIRPGSKMFLVLSTESLMALQKDHAFLTKGGVFTDDVIETYIDYKMKNEISELVFASSSVRICTLLR